VVGFQSLNNTHDTAYVVATRGQRVQKALIAFSNLLSAVSKCLGTYVKRTVNVIVQSVV